MRLCWGQPGLQRNLPLPKTIPFRALFSGASFSVGPALPFSTVSVVRFWTILTTRPLRVDVRLDLEKRRMVSYLVKVAIPELVSSCFPQVSKEDLGGQMTQFWAQPGLGVPLPHRHSGKGHDQQLGRAGRLLKSSFSLFLVKLIHRCGMS